MLKLSINGSVVVL